MRNNQKQNSQKSSNLNESEKQEPIRTAAEVAKKIGVSENTYQDMKLVTESGSQEKIDRMIKGGRGNNVAKTFLEIVSKGRYFKALQGGNETLLPYGWWWSEE